MSITPPTPTPLGATRRQSFLDMTKEADQISDELTLDIDCPTCIAVEGMRCVTKSKRWTKPHADRNRRSVFMREMWEQSRTEMLERLAAMRVEAEERERQERIAAGKSPEPHDEDCVCDDEECWPVREEADEYSVQAAEAWVRSCQQRVTEAQREVDEAVARQQRGREDRYNWERAQKGLQ